jgi:hypothetical protein
MDVGVNATKLKVGWLAAILVTVFKLSKDINITYRYLVMIKLL